MKRIVWLLLVFVSVSSFSQSADERIGVILNRSDWFELEKTYPAVKDSMQADFLKLMSEAFIGYYFNRPAEALESIEKLLVSHQPEIGGQNAVNMAVLSCMLKGMEGMYAEAVQDAQDIMGQLKRQGGGEEMCTALESIHSFYSRLKDVPPPSISRPQEDVVIPVGIERVMLPDDFEPEGWRGTIILMPVVVNGKTYRFIFDTGAGTSAVSEHMAKEMGVRVLNDSVMINPDVPGSMVGKMGVLDSMKIGEMSFYNSLVTLLPPNALDSVLRVDAVLGMDFIGLFDEIRICPKRKEVVFPAIASDLPSSGRNLIKMDRTLKLKAEKNGEELLLHFDTGCSTAGLNYLYYETHKSALESAGKRETVTGGSFNRLNKREVLRIPAFEIKVGGKPVTLTDLIVDVKNHGTKPAEDMGIIGMDLINPFDCVVINLKDMFLELE